MWISGFSYAYYAATYIGFEIVYTMILIPYDTLAAEMTSDFKVRAKLTSSRMYIAQFSAFLAAFLPGRLINALGKQSPNSFLYAGIIFTAIFMVVLTLVYTFTWERPLEEIEALEVRNPREKLNFVQNVQKIFIDLFTTLRIRTFRAHLGMYLGGYLAQDTFNAVFTYFIVFALFKGAVVASNLMALMYIFQIAGVSIASYITIKMNPGASFRVVSLIFMIAILGFLIVYGTVPSSLLALYFVSAVAGLGRGGINFVPWNNYTFVPDVDEIVSGDRREGVFAGFMCFVRKASQALAIFLVGVALQEFNFKSGKGITTQPKEALVAMVVILIAIPAVFLLLGIISSFSFKITDKSHAVLKKEVNRLKNGGSTKTVDSETRKVVEELTGWSYEKLWGNNPIGYKNWKKSKNKDNDREKLSA